VGPFHVEVWAEGICAYALARAGQLMAKNAAPGSTKTTVGASTAANVGYETELWRMADALRTDRDVAESTHVRPTSKSVVCLTTVKS
jgi:hypothetical protein